MCYQSADLLNAVAHAEIERLKTLGIAKLIDLPALTARQIVVDAKMITMNVWYDVLESGEHRVVVQASRAILSGIGGMTCANGFVVSVTGKMREPTDDELTSFT